MYRYIKLKLFLAAVLLLGCVSPVVFAGDDNSDKKTDKFTDLVISGASEPVPALQYRLMPPLIDEKTGNAAVDWNKLISVIPADLDEFNNIKDGDLNYSDLLKLPFDEFKSKHLEYADKFFKVSSMSFLRHAAYRNYCDWQDPIEDGISMLMPNLGDYRKIAKLVALEARVNVARGDYDKAMELLSYNFALSEDIGKGKTLIQGLVGIAIASISYEIIEDIVIQPDSPNLYWALKFMPSPIVDMRNPFEYEMTLWVKLGIEDMETSILSTEQANKRLSEFLQFLNDVPLAAIVAANYVHGKKFLIESGYDPRRVELMPAAQVVMLAQWKEYLPLRDDVFKFLFVPYYQCQEDLDKYNDEAELKRREKVIPNIFYEFLPALKKCKLVVTRVQVKAEALQCVEAIRMYAASHDKLPEQLSDIKEVPLPVNSYTNREFKYYLDGNTAVLDIQEPEKDRDFQGYRIRLNK